MQRLGPGNMRYVARLQKPAARQIVAAAVVRGLAVRRGYIGAGEGRIGGGQRNKTITPPQNWQNKWPNECHNILGGFCVELCGWHFSSACLKVPPELDQPTPLWLGLRREGGKPKKAA